MQLPLFKMDKPCFKCGEIKPLTDFYAHKRMADGRLNKCKVCTYFDTAKNRAKDPDSRKKEYAKWAEKNGIPSRAEYLSERKKNAIGNKARQAKYWHKRRARFSSPDELTEFATTELTELRDLRFTATGIKWHIDHIIPLCHKDVSGLHIWSNLQLVPARWNETKGNRSMAVAGF